MRASAEAWLASHYPQALAMIGGSLSQDVYTYARYMHSEVGSGTVEERVAVGEAGLNRAKMSGRSISQLLMPSGYYGPIHGSDTYCTILGYDCMNKKGVCCAPFHRWAATSRDPSVMSLLLAALVVSGASGDFAQGADDQAGPEAWVSQGQAALNGYVQKLANAGKYWAGPLPGVNHWHTFLTITPDIITRAATGKQLLQRGLDALALPVRPTNWDAQGLATCAKPNVLQSRSAQTFFLAMVGLAAGSALAHLVARRYVTTSA